MVSGHRYRVASVAGAVIATTISLLAANAPPVQSALTSSVPVFQRLPAIVLMGDAYTLALGTTLAVVLASLAPMFKPRPRRILDTVLLAQKRIVVAGLALAAIGYFDYTYRLPRATLILTIGGLLVTVPAWFVAIRRRPSRETRAVVIGDDPDEIRDVLDAVDVPVVGYVSPPSPYYSNGEPRVGRAAVADGAGASPLDDLECLGGLSRFDEVLVEHDIDTAILAFAQPDRAEFFGALDACYEHGVNAKVHREHADSVLTVAALGDSDIVDIELEPWDWQERIVKRLFDVTFAGAALLALSPVVLLITSAIKFEGHGPVFFSQTRTYLFGDTFRIYKFRTLKPKKGGEVGTTIDTDRKTPLGEFLRRTHLDEIPQLWSILVGDMSVVGPRPAQTELEPDFEAEAKIWKQRWFVKPGLTGLAQINDATSQEPERKIRYDIEYIRNQSVQFDMQIIVRQFWQVFQDVAELRSSGTDEQ